MLLSIDYGVPMLPLAFDADTPAGQNTHVSLQAALQHLVDHAPAMVWMTDAADNCVYLNHPGFCCAGQIYGKGLAQWQPFIHPDDAPAVCAHLTQAKALRQEYRVEYRIVKSDGGVRWMLGTGTPKFTPAGEYDGYIGTIMDVSKEHHAFERLAKSEAEYRLLAENTSDLICHCDTEGTYLYVSPSYGRELGLNPSELTGKCAFDYSHPDDVAVLQAEVQRQLDTREPGRVLDVRKRRLDGSYVWMGTKFQVLFDDKGEPTGSVSVSRDITAERDAGRELHRANEQLVTILESIGDAFFSLDKHWRVTYGNQKAAQFIGQARDPALGKYLWEVVPGIEHSTVFTHYERAMASGEAVFFEEYFELLDAWVSVRAYPHEGGLSVFFHDVTKRRQAEQAIRDSEQRLREMIALTPAGYMRTDGQGRVLDVNPALCQMSGYTREEFLGQEVRQFLPVCPMNGAMHVRHGASSGQGRETIIHHKNGHPVYVLANLTIKRDDKGDAVSLMAFVTDITERKQAERRLEELATHDTLTSLPNRVLVNQHLQSLLEEECVDEGLAVMFLDLDGFKEVNDSMGHASGDFLLREVARRLQGLMRSCDMVARLGGDEFVIVAPCEHGKFSASSVAERLLACLADPFLIEGHEVFVSGSLGICMVDDYARTKELLFQNADTAMYRAKASGPGQYCFFEHEMSVEAKLRMTLEHSLRHAVDRGEFELHYQPRVELKTRRLVGVEALIRWNHPQLGRVSPADFIPIAESKGLIVAIGQWVLQEGCRQMKLLMDKYQRPLHVSINLSAHQLKCQDLVEQVTAALCDSGLPPQLLELELTESALIDDVDQSARVLKQLKSYGILLSVDDFGTGYSGLSYLKRFPVDILKLDRSFVHNQPEGISSFDFIKAFVDMAHALKLEVVAEGIETEDTLQLLTNARCDEGQGYLFAKPLPLAELEHFLAALP